MRAPGPRSPPPPFRITCQPKSSPVQAPAPRPPPSRVPSSGTASRDALAGVHPAPRWSLPRAANSALSSCAPPPGTAQTHHRPGDADAHRFAACPTRSRGRRSVRLRRPADHGGRDRPVAGRFGVVGNPRRESDGIRPPSSHRRPSRLRQVQLPGHLPGFAPARGRRRLAQRAGRPGAVRPQRRVPDATRGRPDQIPRQAPRSAAGSVRGAPGRGSVHGPGHRNPSLPGPPY